MVKKTQQRKLMIEQQESIKNWELTHVLCMDKLFLLHR